MHDPTPEDDEDPYLKIPILDSVARERGDVDDQHEDKSSEGEGSNGTSMAEPTSSFSVETESGVSLFNMSSTVP